MKFVCPSCKKKTFSIFQKMRMLNGRQRCRNCLTRCEISSLAKWWVTTVTTVVITMTLWAFILILNTLGIYLALAVVVFIVFFTEFLLIYTVSIYEIKSEDKSERYFR